MKGEEVLEQLENIVIELENDTFCWISSTLYRGGSERDRENSKEKSSVRMKEK